MVSLFEDFEGPFLFEYCAVPFILWTHVGWITATHCRHQAQFIETRDGTDGKTQKRRILAISGERFDLFTRTMGSVLFLLYYVFVLCPIAL